MTIREFDDKGMLTRETYIDETTGKPVRFAEWFFNGHELFYTCYRNRDRNGNYYTTERKCDPSYWLKHMTREQLIKRGEIAG